MKHQNNAERKSRTRVLIQCGGLLSKSGLMDAFSISPEDDLQDYTNRHKAHQLLGFLIECFEGNTFDEENFEKWRKIGERNI